MTTTQIVLRPMSSDELADALDLDREVMSWYAQALHEQLRSVGGTFPRTPDLMDHAVIQTRVRDDMGHAVYDLTVAGVGLLVGLVETYRVESDDDGVRLYRRPVKSDAEVIAELRASLAEALRPKPIRCRAYALTEAPLVSRRVWTLGVDGLWRDDMAYAVPTNVLADIVPLGDDEVRA